MTDYSFLITIVGGVGKTGTVTRVRGWEDNTDMNACNIAWSANDNTNLYRIGWEGKMDLKYVQEAVEGYYYRDHLPILGKNIFCILI